MKHTPIILMTLLLGLTLFGCKKQEQEILTPKITNDKVETTFTTATFTWTVDWPGKLISVVEVSENEDMSNSQFYGSEEETDKKEFSVAVDDLKLATKFYYRYWVWNRNFVDNKFEFEVKKYLVYSSEFSVSETNKVYFSKGNLQYQASTHTWRFAANPWDVVGGKGYGDDITGNVEGSSNSSISSSYSGWIDLFGWGTSGWDNGNHYYHPWNYQLYSEQDPAVGAPVGYGYGPTDGILYTYDLTENYANADWGVYNAISNGGNKARLWRTLTKDEWVYLLDARRTVSGVRFARAKVNNVSGLILLPDDWNADTYNLDYTNTYNSYFSCNIISASQWITLETAGAVFLPAAGTRFKTICNGIQYDEGYYWTATGIDRTQARCLVFHEYNLSPQANEGRYYGLSVRLVRDVE